MADILSLSLNDFLSPNTSNPTLTQTIDQAQSLISPSRSSPSHFPTTLHALLTQIIKPLFTSPHPDPNLTSTGRKRLFPQTSQPSHTLPVSDLLTPQPWEHNPVTIPLLSAILRTYPLLSPSSTQKSTLEEHFYLLVPAILRVSDHHSPPTKGQGYRLLRLLCEACVSANSTVVEKSGLTEVFAESLQSGWDLLPTLTPEDESIVVLSEAYAAFFSLVEARFGGEAGVRVPKGEKGDEEDCGRLTEDGDEIKIQKKTEKGEMRPEVKKRIEMLTLMLRHGILHSLTHLGTGTSSSAHPTLTTFLVNQLSLTLRELGIFAVRDLNVILPMMRGVLTEPFGTVAVELLMAALGVLEAVIEGCAERVRERWWGEVLRGVVGGWCVLVDDEEAHEEQEETREKGRDVKDKEREEYKRQLREVVTMLGKVVKKEEWNDARRRLVAEEEALEDLFEGT